MRAIQVTEFGGPDVLVPTELPDPEPGDGEVLIDVSAAGINFADSVQAENAYLAPQELPLVPGAEVVGTTPDGQRVVALLAGGGGYAERAVAYPALSFPIPEGVSDGEALATVLQGATAWHLLRTCAHLAPGEKVVVHAAAGGVGTIAIQLAKLWGAGQVIASASTDAKRELATELGADAVIDARAENMKEAIQEAAGGKVDIVLEMVGGTTFDGSLASLAPFGRLCTFGMASQQPPKPVDPRSLMRHSSAVIGFWLAHCFFRPDELLRPQITELLDLVEAGQLRAIVGATYPLSEARRAHEDLRGRGTVGKLVLDPSG